MIDNHAVNTNNTEAALIEFASHPLFNKAKNSITENNPFIRPLRPQDLNYSELKTPLLLNNLTDNSYLQMQRILTVIYEQDLLFLPQNAQSFNLSDYMEFYNRDLYHTGEYIRPKLEKHVFDFLDDEVVINSKWSLDQFVAYTDKILLDIKESNSTLYETLTQSKDPKSAAKFFLIQCAGDFLSEASAMGRNILGNLGEFTSELFKIFIDEYGYGVHKKKHSTIFEDLLNSLNMSKDIHAYWQFYTASSLALINYCHYLSKNHSYFFRYLGALYFTEASLAFITTKQSLALKKIFGVDLNTNYFDEHAHIDQYHGKMALTKLIIPVVNKYGIQVLPEILIGFEQFRLLQDLADADFIRHINYHDNIENYIIRISNYENQESRKSPDMRFAENKNEFSVPHMHSVSELFSVEEGEVAIIFSPYKEIILKKNESLILLKGILHGSLIKSESAIYTVTEYKGNDYEIH